MSLHIQKKSFRFFFLSFQCLRSREYENKFQGGEKLNIKRFLIKALTPLIVI